MIFISNQNVLSYVLNVALLFFLFYLPSNVSLCKKSNGQCLVFKKRVIVVSINLISRQVLLLFLIVMHLAFLLIVVMAVT